MVDAPPPPSVSPGAASRLDRVTLLASALASLVGVGLLLTMLGHAGFTWDERGDFDIVRDYASHLSFLSNIEDPSQGRLSHIVATPFVWALGHSYLAFKLPFALACLAGAAVLGSMVRRSYSAVTAALVVAFYLSNPYVLAAGRTGATAGDVLVLVLTLTSVATLHRWLTTSAFWPWGALAAVSCGAATAAKWTNGVWVPAAILVALLHGYRRHRTLFNGKLWSELLAFGAIATGATLAGSPTLLRGVLFVRSAVADSTSYDGHSIRYLGAFYPGPPLRYFVLLLVGKLTPGLALLFVVAAVYLGVRRLRSAPLGLLVPLSMLAVLPCIPLARKSFQNAHYYIGLVAPVLLVTAAFLEQARRRARLDLPVRAAAIALLASQVAFSVSLWPDYLQAGRHLGGAMQGEFFGPAVNHCQSGPWTLRQLGTLSPSPGSLPAYALDCFPILEQDLLYGPVRYAGSLASYPTAARPKEAHFVLINRRYGTGTRSQSEWDRDMALRARAIAGCQLEPGGLGSYAIYLCPATS